MHTYVVSKNNCDMETDCSWGHANISLSARKSPVCKKYSHCISFVLPDFLLNRNITEPGQLSIIHYKAD